MGLLNAEGLSLEPASHGLKLVPVILVLDFECTDLNLLSLYLFL